MERCYILKVIESKFIDYLKKSECFSDIVFICIGTKKVIGDSIGPLIGENLKEIQNDFIHVFGTMDNNINFINGKETIKEIYEKYKNPFIITIDAALSNNNNKGDIVLGSGCIKIGKALNKSVCFYSDINLKCVIGNYHENMEDNIKELKEVKLIDVYNTSRKVTNTIKNSFKKLNIYV